MALFNPKQIDRVKRLGKKDWQSMKMSLDRNQNQGEIRTNLLAIISGEDPLLIGKHIPEADIKDYVNRKILSKNDLPAGVLSTLFTTEDIKQEIIDGFIDGRYTNGEIKEIVEDQGYFTKEDLVDRGLITQEECDLLFPPPPIDDELGSDNLPAKTVPGRHDIFVLGVGGSGKTSFLAGLFYYGKIILGKASVQLAENPGGYGYFDRLIGSVGDGHVMTSTTIGAIQYCACNFESDKGIHPLTFVEMNGEMFERGHLLGSKEVDPKLRNFLFTTTNNKLIFLAISSQVSNFSEAMDQSNKIEYFLKLLESEKVFNTITGIVFLITQWDKPLAESEGELTQFLDTYYKGLVNLCKGYRNKYRLTFKVMKFSVGEFKNKSSYTYKKADSKIIFDMLCEVTPTDSKLSTPQKKTGGNVFSSWLKKR